MIPGVVGLPVTYDLAQGSVAIPSARGDKTVDLRVPGFNAGFGGDLNVSGITSAGRSAGQSTVS